MRSNASFKRQYRTAAQTNTPMARKLTQYCCIMSRKRLGDRFRGALLYAVRLAIQSPYLTPVLIGGYRTDLLAGGQFNPAFERGRLRRDLPAMGSGDCKIIEVRAWDLLRGYGGSTAHVARRCPWLVLRRSPRSVGSEA